MESRMKKNKNSTENSIEIHVNYKDIAKEKKILILVIMIIN